MCFIGLSTILLHLFIIVIHHMPEMPVVPEEYREIIKF